MKSKRPMIFAAAALALCCLFATSAGAEPTASAGPTIEFTACGPFPAAEEAYLENPKRTLQEIHEAWAVNKVRYCASAVIPTSEEVDAIHKIDLCLEGYGAFTKAEIETCIANWENGEAATSSRVRRKKKVHHRAHAHAGAQIHALARALRAQALALDHS